MLRSLGEVDGHPGRAGRERLPDILLALPDQVLLERLPGVAGQLLIQRVQQGQHGRRYHGLLHRLMGQPDGLGQGVRGVSLVAERAAGQPGQLPVMPVREDREVLSPGPGQVIGQAGPGQRVGDRVRREA
jgi:hypothetical protein